MKTWWEQNIMHFEPEEFADPDHYGSGEYADKAMVLCLDDLRDVVGHGIRTTASAGGAVDVTGTHGHSKGSYHLWENGAKAIDFYIEDALDVRDQVRMVLRSGFNGIGIYYNIWHDHKGVLLPVGFHGDMRPGGRFQVWSCRRKGEYVYLI